MLTLNEHYYLLCSTYADGATSLYRIDLMRHAEIDTTPIDASFSKKELNSIQNESLYAWNGQPELVALRCDTVILGDVLNHFGQDITLTPDAVTHFIVKLSAFPIGMRFWALQYLAHAKALAPQALRDAVTSAMLHHPYAKKKRTKKKKSVNQSLHFFFFLLYKETLNAGVPI